jgi:hypothetical protein
VTNSRKPRKCPTCKQTGTIRTIVYGMPMGPVDERKFVLGGCIIDDDSAIYHCVSCDTSVRTES